MLPLHNIKNIIFDLGGVILNINPALTLDEFANIGCHNFQELYTQFTQTELFDRFETGQITTDDFRNELKQKLPVSLSNEQIDETWNKLLLDFPEERIELLQKLKRRFRTFLLSNTNEIHYKKYAKDFRKQFCFEFNSLFEKTYYSFRENMKKPDEQFFIKILEENKLNPAETLFIDDTEIHIEGAKKTGIQTFHLTKGTSINDILW
ncbi:MAG: hypothetical protein A2275_07025 [Bacteroidetes bacterium RIFOXYA12_FULL_35_11]|nr:MAG: hypothetical protein A2X01_04595 [Bacteroidetes bacterium GWF2_35_48]OFY83138.1 MAG: hypothetical protein A2275_07025 [Bacteroidetes bacterium RIFOXYA12_FULL_35_11]OFY92243.1 MAG: hypothetical protein A2309_13540 [Bacteroidetes bacterium RIFOXYB2_FULL_35_7]OFY99299.1 MAG: hypothetical protein A2491_16590 [Bacteroidetes bacterium RIFOXYC12_FULL_35_7]HBX50963.1 hypothetical protein [Bacteroidales bacterium]